jgi:alkaline phosphatase
MGIPTITAGRILINGESYVTHMENLDFSGMVKTYNVDFQTPDSAATATAYLTGVKGRYYTAGLDAGAVLGDCDGSFGHEVESVFEKG